jgi:hypothetical protein
MKIEQEMKVDAARQRESRQNPVEGSLPPVKRKNSRTVLLALILVVTGMVMVFGVAWSKIDRGRACLDSTLVRLRVLQDMVPETFASSAFLDVGAARTELRGLQSDLACIGSEAREFLPIGHGPVFG